MPRSIRRPPHDSLAADISRYWIGRLKRIWEEKPEHIKKKDLRYNPRDPLGRVAQKAVIIAYADSVHEKGRAALDTLKAFLKAHFPAVGGLHILPACDIAEDRFNDGGFSQIRRDRIHGPYGTNAGFEALMAEYFSMTDMVLNHVDFAHPRFQQYLDGDDRAGDCFFIFSEPEYRQRRARGDFSKIFRPRPFPLFTIFRRNPRGEGADRPHDRRVSAMNRRFCRQNREPLPDALVDLLTVFHKIRNDQMLLADDYWRITRFRDFLVSRTGMDPEDLFTVSGTQETRHRPYIFQPDIAEMPDLLASVLPRIGIPATEAGAYAAIYADNDADLFGEPVRALTTFSHVQVDLNTTTFEGLKLLIDDFAWYLKMDLNMLRLDAANFAFKRWGTSCFGLPEVKKLLKILYLSMDCVSPRMVPNLEVNAPLSAVLEQMADRTAPPPMMYDFHLPSLLPVVFNTADARPLLGVFDLIAAFDIPGESIRFSLDESHDGKSVSGSGGADGLLTYAQRRALVRTVSGNGGYVKTKSTPIGRYPSAEFSRICSEAGLDPAAAAGSLFEDGPDPEGMLHLKSAIRRPAHIAEALAVDPKRVRDHAALDYFCGKILEGREPYELCITTRDALERLDDPAGEVNRYLAFKTLAFAVMGRHVKATFFNDLAGLKNDRDLVEKTGELRNIKRTKSDRRELERRLGDPGCAEHWIAGHMNHLIALVDADPACHPRGREARLAVDPAHPAAARVHNACGVHHTLVVVNTGSSNCRMRIRLSDFGLNGQTPLWDNLGETVPELTAEDGTLVLDLGPFHRHWISGEKVEIPPKRLVRIGSQARMREALARGPAR